MLKQQFANYEDKKVRIPVEGRVVKFGVVSDTHLGSRYCQMSFLRWTYDHFKKNGAKFVLHAGDIVDGEGVYAGQSYEICAHGFDEQLEYAVVNYPNTLPTYFITGNHCLSFFEKKGGADIGKALEKQREDLHYLGQLGAFVYIGQAKVYLVHPSGAPPYAISYRGQKLVENMSTENKSNVMILGHYHQSYTFFVRNTYLIGGGGFQGQTPYLRRKAVFPVIGGYLIEIELDHKGIARFKFEFVPCYKPKSNDF